MLLQNLLGTASGKRLAQILAAIAQIGRDLVVGSQLADDGQNVVPVVRLREAKDALVDNVRVDQGGDVETSGVLDVDEPFCFRFSACTRLSGNVGKSGQQGRADLRGGRVSSEALKPLR